MKRLGLFQIDAFAASPFGGNPAAVILDGEGLGETKMQAIAREMNLSQTAFLSPTSTPAAHYRLRWFTPTREVTFCGHATIATCHALFESGRLSPTLLPARLVFETLGGLLPVSVEALGSEDDTAWGVRVWLEPPLARLDPFSEPLAPLLEALGLPAEALVPSLSPVTTPERDLLLPVKSLQVVRSLAPEMTRLGAIAEARGLRGACVTTFETVEPASACHSRFFAPHYGIPEDPTSGSVHVSLALLLWEAGRLPRKDGIHRVQAEQGDELGRPGRLTLEVTIADRTPKAIRVGGQAVTVLRGELFIP